MHADQACNEWMSEENLLSYERELLGFEKRTKFEAENPGQMLPIGMMKSSIGKIEKLPMHLNQSQREKISAPVIVWIIRI